LLFLGNHNRHRSKTAEELFRNDYMTQSTGLYNKHPVTSEQLNWADLVFVMNYSEAQELSRRFPELASKKKVINLDIPDNFTNEHPQLKEMLKTKISTYLG
ncbi:phosphotyrosine protein phosphatase, partial [archaeon]|nr:phosphotyrosine protein phosphatase [archaeon]